AAVNRIDEPLAVEPATSATRLVFCESDGLSGLVVDRYGDYLVVQPTSLGMAQRIGSIVGILQGLVQPKGVVLKLDKAMAKLEGFVGAAVAGHVEDPHPKPLPEGEGMIAQQPAIDRQRTGARQRTNDRDNSSLPINDGHVWGELPEGTITIRENGIAY